MHRKTQTLSPKELPRSRAETIYSSPADFKDLERNAFHSRDLLMNLTKTNPISCLKRHVSVSRVRDAACFTKDCFRALVFLYRPQYTIEMPILVYRLIYHYTLYDTTGDAAEQPLNIWLWKYA